MGSTIRLGPGNWDLQLDSDNLNLNLDYDFLSQIWDPNLFFVKRREV